MTKSYFRVTWNQDGVEQKRDLPSMRQADAWARDMSRSHGTADLHEGIVEDSRTYYRPTLVASFAHGARVRKALVA